MAPAVQGLAFAMAYDQVSGDQVSGFETVHEEASAAIARLLDRLAEQRARR